MRYAILFIIVLAIVYGIYPKDSAGAVKPPVQKEVKTNKKFPEFQEVIGTFKYGEYTRNVVSITDWQKKIMDKNKISFQTQLYLRTLQTMECGDENGFCMNRFDAGPFQINQIHVVEHKESRRLVTKGIKAVEVAKKTGNWKEVITIRNKLYEYQMLWTFNRMKSQVVRFELPENREKRIYSLAKLHNGSKTKEQYAEKAKISYKILLSYYAK